MKRLKKFLTTILIALFTLTLTACNNIPLQTDGVYWFDDTTSFPSGYSETLVYDVSLSHVTPASSEEVKVDGYTLQISTGRYTTTLETRKNTNGDYYVYTTSFLLEGSYVTPNETKPFMDTFTTKTEFYADFTPIKSQKTYKSELNNYSYSYDINYAGSKANCKVTEFIGTNNENTKEFSFDKYNESAYIDNEVILLFGRLFNVDGSFSQPFSTIDAISRKLHKMSYSAGIINENLDVKSLDNYVINGVNPTEPKVNCARVGISISDTFSGNTIEAYYATDHKTHRHRLVETYTRITGGIGYIKYSLKSATINN